jgi:hypothetical protein
MGALTDMREAPDEPPETIAVFPFAVAYAERGRWDSISAAWAIAYHTIILEIHVSRKDLPRDIQKAMAYSESVSNALIGDITLNGTVDTITTISYIFGPLGWNEAPSIGWRYEIGVKQKQVIS